MIRILLVDDEPFILKGLRNMVLSLGLNLEIAGEAENGEDALKLMSSIKPDIIITDIKMPIMDGLALIENIALLYPGTSCIILSGYSDFEYARKSLKLRVNDYLLKPVMPDELRKVLVPLIEEKERVINLEDLKVLDRIVNNAPSFTNMEGFDYKSFIVFYLCIGPIFSGDDYSVLEKNDYQIVKSCRKLVEEACSGHKIWQLNGKYPNEKIILVGFKSSVIQMNEEIYKKLHSMLQTGDIPLNIAAGKCTDGFRELAGITGDLRKKLKRRIVIGESMIILPEDNEEESISGGLSIDKEKRLRLFVQQNNWQAFKNEFLSVMEECRVSKYPQISVIKITERVFHIIEYYTNCSLRDYTDVIDELFSSSTNYQELIEGLKEVLKLFFRQDCTSSKHDREEQKKIAIKIEEYMKTHISEHITLQILADRFGYSPAYICSLYKVQRGISPLKYHSSLRINKAKELIKNQSDFKLKEVAAILGFDDPLYFSRIFKKETGMSPQKFREQG